MMDSPLLVGTISLVALWASAQAGWYVRRMRGKLEEDERTDLGVVLAATLTLLGLVIGFAFSMAIGRYDQRKSCEAAEANAIGTEYARAGLLPASDTVLVRELLRSYLDQRGLFYTSRNAQQLQQIGTATARLQADLWNIVQARAALDSSPIIALTVAGMNDVLNSQAYTQAAWWNRIPPPAWALMTAIAICCNVLVGYTAHQVGSRIRRFFVLPLIVAISFFLIGDIDSPSGGLIRVHPQNLVSVSQSLGVTR